MKNREKNLYAHFRAEILWMVQPILSRQRKDTRFFDQNLIIEPCDLGGCIIAAVSGTAMAVFRDPEGYCKEAMSVLVPEDAFDHCKPHVSVAMNYCGQQYSPELPEWAQAGQVVMHSSGMFVGTRMRHPDWMTEDDEFYPCLYQRTSAGNSIEIGVDYKADAGSAVEWRAVISKSIELANRKEALIGIAPGVIGLFDRIHNTITEKHQDGTHFYARQTLDSESGDCPIVLRISDCSDFVGIMMPMRLPKEPEVHLPEWLTATFPETQGGIQ